MLTYPEKIFILHTAAKDVDILYVPVQTAKNGLPEDVQVLIQQKQRQSCPMDIFYRPWTGWEFPKESFDLNAITQRLKLCGFKEVKTNQPAPRVYTLDEGDTLTTYSVPLHSICADFIPTHILRFLGLKSYTHSATELVYQWRFLGRDCRETIEEDFAHLGFEKVDSLDDYLYV